MLDILTGHINEILERNNEIYKFRIKICKSCPLFDRNKVLGWVCSNKLWINKDGEVSKKEKDGFVKGCGCRLEAKLRNMNSKCIISKW